MARSNFRPYDASQYPLERMEELKVGIVRTEWNEAIVDKLEASCRETLKEVGISEKQITGYTVPGSFELPLGAKYLLTSTQNPDIVICLGCVIQGETKHDDYISHTVARAISQISLLSGVPVVFGVLTTNTEDQAYARAGGDKGDKGRESALAGIKMLSMRQQLKSSNKRISF